MKNKPHLSIEEAIENLSNLSEMSENDNIVVLDKHKIVVKEKSLSEKSISFIDESELNQTEHVIKETFKVVLHYIRDLYRKNFDQEKENKAVEGIKTIMVLVGDAAKNFEDYSALFETAHKFSASSLKEYRQLQSFYRSKIASEHSEEHEEELLIQRDEVEGALEDLEVVRQDSDYEFFFIKKENGESFFKQKLLRNIKLACDFGEDSTDFSTDPLIFVKNWQDKDYQVSAKNMLKICSSQMYAFYEEAMRYKEMFLVSILNKSIMALMLAANPKNLLRRSSVKSSYSYFKDFQFYLRKLLKSKDYHKMVAYPPEKKFLQDMLDLIEALCKSLYLHVNAKQEIEQVLDSLIGEQSMQSIAKHFESSNEAVNQQLKKHPNGPLFKFFDLLQEEQIPIFDNFFQDNIPHHLFDMYLGEHKVAQLHLPSPTAQEFVHQAEALDEFKGFLRSYSISQKKHLLFNLQDRTSWKDHARCTVIEDLQRQAEYGKSFIVLTFAMDTDFYHQLPPYHKLEDAESFIVQFNEHLYSENTGYYFPKVFKDIFEKDFSIECMDLLHQFLFKGKAKLNKAERQIFIDFFYFLLQIKAMEILHPDSMSFTCKDGIDIGGISTASFYSLFKLLSKDELSKEDGKILNTLVFAPALIIRERCPHIYRFKRMYQMISYLESIFDDRDLFLKAFSKSFGSIFSSSFEERKVLANLSEEDF